MIRVGIVGGTGYTGVELLRLLAAHGEVSDAASLVNDHLSEFANSMNT